MVWLFVAEMEKPPIVLQLAVRANITVFLLLIMDLPGEQMEGLYLPYNVQAPGHLIVRQPGICIGDKGFQLMNASSMK